MNNTRNGSCLCGSVRFSVSGDLREVWGCHCSQCRKQTGLYYAATNAADDTIEIADGGTLKWYWASNHAKRGFCNNCGSALFWKMDGSSTTSILAGSFDQPTGLKMTMHIFTGDKGDFYDIADGLPQHAAAPPR